MMTTHRLSIALFAFALLGLGSFASADSPPPPKAKTAQEHRTEAKAYRDKAENYRGEGRKHQMMLEHYLNPGPPYGKGGVVQEDDKWMIQHCNRFIEQANALAATAEELAKGHDKAALKAVQAEKTRP